MVIEDDWVLSANLRENLESLGYEVVASITDHQQALAAVQRVTPDIYIVDIELSGSTKNGIEIMQEINTDHRIPIIYLTSYDQDDYRQKAKSTSPANYLLKPAGKNQLDIAIDIALHNHYEQTRRQKLPLCPAFAQQHSYFIREVDKYIKIAVADMCVIKGDHSYSSIYTPYKEFKISGSLGRILEQLNVSDILRCHRSYAININCIQAFTEHELHISIGNEMMTIPLSNTYKKEIMDQLIKIKTL